MRFHQRPRPIAGHDGYTPLSSLMQGCDVFDTAQSIDDICKVRVALGRQLWLAQQDWEDGRPCAYHVRLRCGLLN